MSDFYVSKYRPYNLDLKNIKSYSDFQKIPLLNKKEITDRHPSERQYLPNKDIIMWMRTSGTTSSKPLLVPAGRHKAEHIDEIGKALKKSGVKKFLSLRPYPMLNIDLLDFSSHPVLSSYPIIFSDLTDLTIAAKTAASIRVDGIDTTPTALYFLIPHLKKEYNPDKIRYIRLVGEFTSEQRFSFFKRIFKNAYFHFDWGLMEARGSMAVRCEFLDTNYSPRFYHPKKDFFYENLDEEGNVKPEGEIGELVLTSLFKGPFPLIRYKTGDSVSITKFRCKCGRNRLIELYGRTGYDHVRVGGITLYRQFVEEALNTIFNGDFKGDYELHIKEKVYREKIIPQLLLKITAKIKNRTAFSKKFQKRLKVASNLYLETLVERENFAPTKIQYVKEFKKSYKKVKIISHLK
jgi:phenylacetate-CoA ligase